MIRIDSLRLRFALAFALSVAVSVPAFAQSTPPVSPAPPTSAAAASDADIPVDNEPAAPADTTPLRDPTAADPAPADPSLLPVYKAFGEKPGLIALMDDLMRGLLADPRTKPFFENVDQEGVKKHLVEQFCVILGGPCTYTGRDMKTVHAHLDIDRSNFNALVEDLQVAMNKRHIPFHAQNKLLAKLAPMHREIETR
ncbi:MAG TPA: group 1 truncated hemoglobin [Arenimonas sp.]|uniref:group I truncated hemoglobin n=1 Tax=Arenimonas sp. TaxID=1872635 RepID=UPI002B763F7F|nr:group 1 truncated hemoglobin [Arenimonas sp.]HMB55868.1 group 1 truncated hemoglobin [Arenimonas sp.]